MCLYYAATRKEPFTRRCYRYGEMRGQRVPGHWRCGEYPRPAGSKGNSQSGKRAPERICPCGATSVSADGWCEECYVYEQIVNLPQEAKQNVDPAMLRKAQQRMAELHRGQ